MMSKSNMDEVLEQILAILKKMPDGAKIAEIAQLLSKSIPQRTLLRRLTALKDMSEIESQGHKSATRYYIKQSKLLLPLSKEGESLKAQVKQEIQKREPVGYHPDFLYAYKPNETYYLTEVERKHLQEKGQQFNHELEPGTYVKRILDRLLIDLSWNSSRLEGNSYSRLDTERLIEFGAEAEGKAAFETQMIMNHKAAIEFIVDCVDDPGFTKYRVLNIHALLSNNLLANPKARGQLRQIPVGIGQTVYRPPEIPQLIAECFQQILTVSEKINDPFEQAFFTMVHLPYLQPFEDVNKRVSRLVANIPLIRNNLSPLSFVDVPKDDYVSGLLAIYELNRIELMRDVFIWAYERSAKEYKLTRETIGEPDIFNMKYKNELKTIINKVVKNHFQGKEILLNIEAWAKNNISSEDQEQFILTAEKELSSLHVGNIAIYQIKPSVFSKWQKSAE